MSSIKKIINNIKEKNSTVVDISSVAGGTVVAQGIGILLIPIISRIYSPADFGIASVFVSTITIFSLISGLGYFFAIPLPKSDRYANSVIILTFLLHTIFTVLLALLLLTLGTDFFKKIGLEELYSYKMLIPLGIFMVGLYNILTQWAIRSKSFSSIGKTKIAQSLVGNISKIILGVINIKPLGLLLGDILSRASGSTTLLKEIVAARGLPKTNKRDIRRVAIKYRNFPLFDIWSNLLNAAGYHLVPYLILIFYSSRITGYFSMAYTLMAIPGSLIGSAIGQVFVQRAATAYHKGSISDITLKTFIILLRFSLFPILLLSSMSPFIFSIVLGETWKEAGIYSMLLGPWVMIMFIQSPLSSIFSIMGQQKQALFIEIAYSVTRIAAFLLGSLSGNARVAIASLSIAGFIVTVFRLWYVLISSGNKTGNIIKISIPIVIESLLLLTVPFLFYFITPNSPCFVISGFVVFAVYIYRNILLYKNAR